MHTTFALGKLSDSYQTVDFEAAKDAARAHAESKGWTVSTWKDLV